MLQTQHQLSTDTSRKILHSQHNKDNQGATQRKNWRQWFILCNFGNRILKRWPQFFFPSSSFPKSKTPLYSYSNSFQMPSGSLHLGPDSDYPRFSFCIHYSVFYHITPGLYLCQDTGSSLLILKWNKWQNKCVFHTKDESLLLDKYTKVSIWSFQKFGEMEFVWGSKF